MKWMIDMKKEKINKKRFTKIKKGIYKTKNERKMKS